MKKIFIFLIISIFVACSNSISNNHISIKFSYNELDFGLYSLIKEVEYSFEFSNPREKVLLIHNVTTYCGCTVTEWSKNPIKRNESGKTIVKYDSEYPRMFSKEITVYHNGKDSPAIFHIKGKVEYPEVVDS